MKARILVIDDDVAIRNNVHELLTEEGFDVVAAASGADGVSLAQGLVPELVICDIGMPGLDGYGVLTEVRGHPRTASIPFIFLTAKDERVDVRRGMNLGADDYVTKPFTLRELLDAVHARLKRMTDLDARARRAVEQLGSAPASAPAFAAADGVVVEDPAMQELYEQAQRVGASNINVLILGETGVGKELLARAVHRLSARREGPFVALNCSALPETLLEAELFGHEKGAFTGAFQSRIGLLESADSGTVFLDEVGDLPLPIQIKLLRVLEDRLVLPLGGRNPRPIDVRFVSATNRDLEQASGGSSFREDLYYRLSGVSFTIPPLRERAVEIEALSRVFLVRASAEQGRPSTLGITERALQALQGYAWPGNVRELRNVLERGVALCRGEELDLGDLPQKIQGVTRSPGRSEPPPEADRARLERALDDLDRRRILEALERVGGNQTRAAELLGVSRRTLVYWLDALDLPRPRKRS